MRKMKKVLSVCLSTVLLCGTFMFFVSAAVKGDIDADGEITASDARFALRGSVGLEEFSEEEFTAADYDEDGTVTASDARMILRVSVGLEANDPVLPDEPEEHIPSARELQFYQVLYNTAHPYLGQHKAMFNNDLMKNFQKWCCLYTVRDVFRPALKTAGYSEDEINLLAPNKFSKTSLVKALSNLTGASWPEWLVVDTELYVPSLLADYYIKTPEAGQSYFLYDYYDDVVDLKVYEHSENAAKTYEPRIGDVLFMSNKTRTYENGYPTIDHTAQIIEVYDDGTFLCTEGSIIEAQEGDNLARVRERKYRFNKEHGTYEFVGNPTIIVLVAFQPELS